MCGSEWMIIISAEVTTPTPIQGLIFDQSGFACGALLLK